ncbi:MAG: enoyl-CoA hydratase/isomerase family protein [Rhodovibrionaceae bacterium]
MPETKTEDLVTYDCAERIVTLTLNRPDKLNALSGALLSRLEDCLARFDADPEADVAILCGGGRAFSSGVDVQESQLRSREELRQARDPMAPGTPVGDFLAYSVNSKPVIAAVHGYALGLALGLVLKCDLIVAEEGARFQVTETARGLGGYRHWPLLSQRAAPAFADEVCLTGRFFTAQEAQAAGLLARLAAPGELLDCARALAGELAAIPPLSLRETLRVQRWHRQRFAAEVAFQTEGVKLELTEDFEEAARAFAEKRKPGPFKGR